MDNPGFNPNMFEEEIVALEQKIANCPSFDQLIIFYGSSSFRLWETMEQDLAPLNTLNLGFGGSSFGWCIHYFNRLLGIIPKASHIVFYCGDNDLENGLSPESVMKKFRTLLEITRDDFLTTPISVLTIKPSPSRTYLQPKIKLTNDLIRKNLIGSPKAYQINIYDSMLNERGVARPELYLDDELHMNDKGYKIWKGIIRKHFGV
ncbi:MAG: lysophospholipase L1-like esterase [Cyclobacteriaceae bacterium]|jgi:lysophospholipase L1-like esterase